MQKEDAERQRGHAGVSNRHRITPSSSKEPNESLTSSSLPTSPSLFRIRSSLRDDCQGCDGDKRSYCHDQGQSYYDGYLLVSVSAIPFQVNLELRELTSSIPFLSFVDLSTDKQPSLQVQQVQLSLQEQTITTTSISISEFIS